MTELEARMLMVDTMRNWIGVTEGSSLHKQIIDLYNSYLPHPRGYKVTYNDAWCAATVSAAAIRNGFTDICPVECGCSELIKLYQKLGRWTEDDSYIPSPADLIFYDWNDNGIGDNKGAPNHVGLVEMVSNGIITVIEGNKSGSPDAVARRTIAVNGKFIRGFGCPDYASKVTILSDPILETVNLAVKDGVIGMPDYWVSVIKGEKIAEPRNVISLIAKYHTLFVGTEEAVAAAMEDGVIGMPEYWLGFLRGEKPFNPGNLLALISKYHTAYMNEKGGSVS